MLDRDLAELYQVETRALKQAVKRNRERFPDDFMFYLTLEELRNWRSQFVTSNTNRMWLRHAPMAITEQGVAGVQIRRAVPRGLRDPERVHGRARAETQADRLQRERTANELFGAWHTTHLNGTLKRHS